MNRFDQLLMTPDRFRYEWSGAGRGAQPGVYEFDGWTLGSSDVTLAVLRDDAVPEADAVVECRTQVSLTLRTDGRIASAVQVAPAAEDDPPDWARTGYLVFANHDDLAEAAVWLRVLERALHPAVAPGAVADAVLGAALTLDGLECR